MHRFVLATLAAFWWSNGVLAQCQFFKIHPAVFEHLRETGPCRGPVLSRDTDGDLVPDWMYAEHFGDVWLPADFDIDDDGVENVRDPNVFRALPGDQQAASGFPAHLLADNPQSQRLQRQIEERFGVLVVPYSAHPRPATLRALEQALSAAHQLVGASHLRALRYVYITSRQHRPEAAAYYLAPAESILLPEDATVTAQQLKATLWHEIGHAVIFASFAPDELAALAATAGWSLPSGLASHYDRSLLQPFFGEITASSAFPTSYAMHSVHEWFAENFAQLFRENHVATKWQLAILKSINNAGIAAKESF